MPYSGAGSTESPRRSACVSSHAAANASGESSPDFAALGVDAVLEAVHRHLAEDRRDGAVERLGQEREARSGVGRFVEEPLEHDRLAEDRRRLGDRERSRYLEDALLLAGEVGVDAMAQLVRHRQDVARAGGVVQHHVGVGRRDRVGAESAAALAGGRAARRCSRPRRSPDGGLAQLRREAPVAVEDELAGVGVADPLLLHRDRRHAVVVGELVEAEELRLQAIPAPGQLVVGDDGLDQRLDRLVGRLVREVAGREPVLVGAQAILRRLVLEQRVEDERARAEPGLEGLRHSVGRLGAPLAIGVLEAAERFHQRHGLVRVGQLDHHARDLLGEEAAERGAARSPRSR